MRNYTFVLSTTQVPLRRKILDHYLFLDPIYGLNFTYPSTAWGNYFYNAYETPPEATAYFNRVGTINIYSQQLVSEFIYQLKQENLWDSLVDGWLLSKNLNAGTGTVVYALKNDADNGVFGQGVNGKLPTWENNGVRFYNDGTGAAGLGPRIDVPTWTHRVSAPMSIVSVFSPFSATGNTGSGVFGQTSWGGGIGQHFGINFDSNGNVTGQAAIYVGNENIDAGYAFPHITPLSGQQYIMVGAVSTGSRLSGGIDSLPAPAQAIGGAGATTTLTAVAIGYELSGGGAYQNAFPYDGLINCGFVFNKAIDYRKFYEIYYSTAGVTVPMAPILNPSINWDLDAYAYMLRVGLDRIADSDKIILNNFVLQLKAAGLWSGMNCWICSSRFNAGAGSRLYSLGDGVPVDGTITGSSWSWTASGILSNTNSTRIVTSKKRLGYNQRTFYTVAKVTQPLGLSRGRIMYTGFAEPAFQQYNINCQGMSLAETIPTDNSGAQIGSGGHPNYAIALGPPTTYGGFASHAATFGGLTIRHYRNLALSNATVGGAWASSINDGTTLCLMNATGDDYGMGGYLSFAYDHVGQFSLGQLTTLNNIVKATICNDLGLP